MVLEKKYGKSKNKIISQSSFPTFFAKTELCKYENTSHIFCGYVYILHKQKNIKQ